MKEFHVFCDESHTVGYIYQVQGGIWIPDDQVINVRRALADLRASEPGYPGEVRWKRIIGDTPSRIYTRLIDLFCNSPFLSFKCMVTHRDKNPSRFGSAAARDLGFYKGYYEFLYRRVLHGVNYRIWLDERPNSPATIDAERTVGICLNNAGRSEPLRWRVRSCRPADSKLEPIIQLADVLSGAVAWSWNRRKDAKNQKNQPGGHPARAAICAQLRAGLAGWHNRTLAAETAAGTDLLGHPYFDIGQYDPTKGRGVRSGRVPPTDGD